MTKLTDAQQTAVRQPGNVLVVAGAGTGKTRTLVRRCIRLLLEEHCGLDEILMVTFTEAAAAEMRRRIAQELRELLGSETEPARAAKIKEQLLLLDAAHIGTLHGFCLKLVRRHTHQLGIDPAISVLEPHQTAPLIRDVFEQIFRRYYDEKSAQAENVRALVRDVGGGEDRAVREVVLKLHRYSQSLANSEQWLAEQERIYADVEPNRWREYVQAGFRNWAQEWLPELKRFAGIPAIDLFIRALDTLGETASFEKIVATVCQLKQIEEDDDNWPQGSKSKKVLDSFRKELKQLCGRVGTGSAPHLLEDWAWARPQMLALLRVTREFGARFLEAKRQLGGLDFADFEQFALRLLRNPITGAATSVARQWQERLRFILVDECQDINRAQDAIIRAISREEPAANRFLVGDVKQSIYRFRLAEPRIFLEYEQSWREDGQGTRVPLADNFRSRQSILTFVNALFSALMRPMLGGLAYNADAHLQIGEPTEHRGDASPRVALHLIDTASIQGTDTDSEDDDNEEAADVEDALLDLTKEEREARLAANLLRDLRKQQQIIWDDERQVSRPVEWRDMAVLMRGTKNCVECYAKEFARLGVPLVAKRSGFFRAIEVTDLLNLLRILDNPLQDLPLLAVLRSPLVALSLDELAVIRIHNSERPFWSALRHFHAAGSAVIPESGSAGIPAGVSGPLSAWDKVDRFLRLYHEWRALSRQAALSECLERILAETHYETLLLAGERGAERAANVQRLLNMARDYDPYQRQGLYRFLRFIELQEDEELEHDSAPPQTENAVQLLTIHQSKGLEFPVVLLAGLGAGFNEMDLRSEVLINDAYGLCPQVRPPGGQRFSGVIHWLGKRAERRERLGEELRLLYVALTRARDLLLLTGSAAKIGWAPEPGRVMSDRDLLVGKPLDWFLRWLPAVTNKADWTCAREGGNALLRWRLYDADDPFLLPAKGEAESDAANKIELDDAALQRLQNAFAWRYGHLAATQEPAVKRISEVIWSADASEEQLLLPYERRAIEPGIHGRRRKSGALSAADVGNAHHLFLQAMPLGDDVRLVDLQERARLLVADGLLTKEEADALDLEGILGFWQSDIGEKILAQAEHIHREIPFTARFAAADFQGLQSNAAELEGEYFVVRGAADLAVVLPEEIWLLDFKTGQVSGENFDATVGVYARQLQLYALALSRIYRRRVTARWLHFLSLRRTVTA